MTKEAKDVSNQRAVNLPGGSRVTYNQLTMREMAMHCHDALQIMIPLDEARFDITWSLESRETETKTLTAGDICIIPPFLEHEIHWQNAHFVSLYMPSSFLYESTEKDYDRNEQLFDAQIGVADSYLYMIGSNIRQHFNLHADFNFKFFDSILVVASNYLLDNYTITSKETAHNLFDLSAIPCDKVRQAMHYINAHLDQTISIEDVAQSVNMSQYHFMRVFKEMTGISPAKFHMQQRIIRAKEMLRKDKEIIDVAYSLGFSSQSHFSNVFSKSVGTTPKRYKMTLHGQA